MQWLSVAWTWIAVWAVSLETQRNRKAVITHTHISEGSHRQHLNYNQRINHCCNPGHMSGGELYRCFMRERTQRKEQMKTNFFEICRDSLSESDEQRELWEGGEKIEVKVRSLRSCIIYLYRASGLDPNWGWLSKRLGCGRKIPRVVL